MTKQPRIALAITGGSGIQYALRLIEVLAARDCHLYLMVSDAAYVVLAAETQYRVENSDSARQTFFSDIIAQGQGRIELLAKNDWFSAPASGSNPPDYMAVVPASGGSLSAIANGACNNLIERAADVMLKERKPLIFVPREAPLSAIHLRNMLTLTELGGIIIPASPGFYHQPQTIADLIDFIVDRILIHLGQPTLTEHRWGS